jgi:hypothetical protein
VLLSQALQLRVDHIDAERLDVADALADEGLHCARAAGDSERDATDLGARATPITRALDNRFARMINSGNLGLAALLTGET